MEKGYSIYTYTKKTLLWKYSLQKQYFERNTTISVRSLIGLCFLWNAWFYLYLYTQSEYKHKTVIYIAAKLFVDLFQHPPRRRTKKTASGNINCRFLRYARMNNGRENFKESRAALVYFVYALEPSVSTITIQRSGSMAAAYGLGVQTTFCGRLMVELFGGWSCGTDNYRLAMRYLIELFSQF